MMQKGQRCERLLLRLLQFVRESPGFLLLLSLLKEDAGEQGKGMKKRHPIFELLLHLGSKKK